MSPSSLGLGITQPLEVVTISFNPDGQTFESEWHITILRWKFLLYTTCVKVFVTSHHRGSAKQLGIAGSLSRPPSSQNFPLRDVAMVILRVVASVPLLPPICITTILKMLIIGLDCWKEPSTDTSWTNQTRINYLNKHKKVSSKYTTEKLQHCLMMAVWASSSLKWDLPVGTQSRMLSLSEQGSRQIA